MRYYLVQLINGKINYLQIPSHPNGLLNNFPISCTNKSIDYPNYIGDRKNITTVFENLKNKYYVPLFNINLDSIKDKDFVLKWDLYSLSDKKELDTTMLYGKYYNLVIINYFRENITSYLIDVGLGYMLTSEIDNECMCSWKYNPGNNRSNFFLIENEINTQLDDNITLNYINSTDINNNDVCKLIGTDKCIPVSYIS